MRRVLYPIILNRVAQSVGADESRSFMERSRAVALRKRLTVPWFVKALCVAAVVLFVPQVAWASSYGADSLVRVSGTSPFAGSNCGLAGQTGKNFLNSEVEPFVDVNPANGQHHRRVAAGPLVERRFARQRGGRQPRQRKIMADRQPDQKFAVHRGYGGQRRRLRACLRP